MKCFNELMFVCRNMFTICCLLLEIFWYQNRNDVSFLDYIFRLNFIKYILELF